MQEALDLSCDPQAAIVISEQSSRRADLSPGEKRVRLDFPVNELSETAFHVDQDYAVVTFGQSYDVGRSVWPRIEPSRTRLPSPQSRCCPPPQIAPAVLLQGEHPVADIAVGCLCNRVDHTVGNAVANLPRCVPVLTHVQRRIQRKRTRPPRQQHTGQQKA